MTKLVVYNIPVVLCEAQKIIVYKSVLIHRNVLLVILKRLRFKIYNPTIFIIKTVLTIK